MSNRFVVIGGANVDLKCQIAQQAVLGTSNPGQVQSSVGGVGRNIAHNLALLGCRPRLITALGRDAHAEMIHASCAKAGIELSAAEFDMASGSYTAILDQSGDLVIAVAAMAIMDQLSPVHLGDLAQSLTSSDTLVCDANLSIELLDYLGKACAKAGARFILEPVSVPKAARLLPLLEQALPVFLMSPNIAQIAVLTGANKLELDDLAAACRQLHRRGVQNILVGLGAQGVFWSDGTASGRLESKVTRLVDATGAGDAALAAALWALDRGHNLREAAVLGQKAAALTAADAASVSPSLSPDSLLKERA